MMNECENDFAQIEILPAEHSGKILSARNIVVIRNLSVVSPLLFVIGIGLSVWGGMTMRPQDEAISQTNKTFSIILLSTAFLLFVFSVIVSTRDFKNRWLRRVAQREIKNRSDKFIDPDASNARFVEIVPKSNWSIENMPENATDVGFLAIDHQNKLILFEGDNERYRIPAKAIVKCGQDFYSRSTTIDKYGARYEIRFYFVVVTVKISEQSIVEIPFRIRISKGLFSDKSQRDGNYEFLREINSLI